MQIYTIDILLKMTKKALSEMTLDELWELFPIELVPHNQAWGDIARGEINHLSDLLADFSPVINHIGSTAIPDIMAKPIIDILVEIPLDIEWHHAQLLMEKSGYICMSHSESRISFNKGYTSDGYADKVFHIHFHRTGDNDEIRFRDCLIANRELASEYERLKCSLLPEFRINRDGYTAAKSNFIISILSSSLSSD